MSKYDHHTQDTFVRLFETRDRRDSLSRIVPVLFIRLISYTS